MFQALSYLIKVSSENTSSDNLAAQYAVTFVAESNNQELINKLIDFLMGETDGIPQVY